MRISEKGINLIKKYEAFSSVPYVCPAGLPTIGYGNTYYPNMQKVKMTDKAITKDEADVIFKKVLSYFETDVNVYVIPNLKQQQFDALCSFAYNVGIGNFKSSTLLKKVNANPNDPTIKAEFLKWNKSKGRVLNGLTKRRNEEANLYFS